MNCRICNKECGTFIVCYNHRNTKYIDNCYIHGKTYFINGQCLKCRQLKEPIYRIINNKDRFNNDIDKTHFLYPYNERLTNLNKKYQQKYIQRISHTSGIYGIFYNNVCLYVGQSVDISNRIHQHKENFKTAKYHISSLRRYHKRISLNKIEHKVEFKYYEMANKYDLNELTFKTLFKVPRLRDNFEFNELLTCAEQAMIDTYKPKYNTLAARPTRYNKN